MEAKKFEDFIGNLQVFMDSAKGLADELNLSDEDKAKYEKELKKEVDEATEKLRVEFAKLKEITKE